MNFPKNFQIWGTGLGGENTHTLKEEKTGGIGSEELPRGC